jgi:hypothetical protein
LIWGDSQRHFRQWKEHSTIVTSEANDWVVSSIAVVVPTVLHDLLVDLAYVEDHAIENQIEFWVVVPGRFGDVAGQRASPDGCPVYVFSCADASDITSR